MVPPLRKAVENCLCKTQTNATCYILMVFLIIYEKICINFNKIPKILTVKTCLKPWKNYFASKTGLYLDTILRSLK